MCIPIYCFIFEYYFTLIVILDRKSEEIDLVSNLKDWENMNDNDRHFLTHILAFFAASDDIVNENLAANFANEVQITEVRCFYGFQIAVENIHSETYSLLIDTLLGITMKRIVC